MSTTLNLLSFIIFLLNLLEPDLNPVFKNKIDENGFQWQYDKLY